MATAKQSSAYSILNDPDTGIRLPGERNRTEGRTHITIETIADQLRASGAICVITFDQSDYRNSGLTRKEQRQSKMRQLADEGFQSFYYVSHAPFLFAAPNAKALHRVRSILMKAGIPEERLEYHQQHAEHSARRTQEDYTDGRRS